jgi:hypothetical protein
MYNRLSEFFTEAKKLLSITHLHLIYSANGTDIAYNHRQRGHTKTLNILDAIERIEGDVLTRIVLRSGTSWLAIFAGQGIICASAVAAPITVTDTINISTALSAGGTYNGLFDINSLLPTTGNYSAPLNILSATLTVYGYSSPAAQQVLGQYSNYAQSYSGSYYYTYYYYVPGYTYYYNCGWGDTCSYYYGGYYQQAQASAPVYTNTRTVTNTNLDSVTDTLQVTTGDQTFSGSDSRTIVDNGVSQTYDGQSGNTNGGAINYYYTNTDNVDDFIYGNLSATGALDAASLALLGQGGTLSFVAAAASGQFTITQYALSVTLEQSVPEPGTLSVFGFSLLLLALRARSLDRPARRQ